MKLSQADILQLLAEEVTRSEQSLEPEKKKVKFRLQEKKRPRKTRSTRPMPYDHIFYLEGQHDD